MTSRLKSEASVLCMGAMRSETRTRILNSGCKSFLMERPPSGFLLRVESRLGVRAWYSQGGSTRMRPVTRGIHFLTFGIFVVVAELMSAFLKVALQDEPVQILFSKFINYTIALSGVILLLSFVGNELFRKTSIIISFISYMREIGQKEKRKT